MSKDTIGKPGEQLSKQGLDGLRRCEEELRFFISVAEDYDLDGPAIASLESAIDSMRFRRRCSGDWRE